MLPSTLFAEIYLNDRSAISTSSHMARPRTFDADAALDDAIGVFREHGFDGSSARMLVDAMGIGRQSLYDAFGDKWQLYCASVRRYAKSECSAHLKALRSERRAVDGIEAMLRRVVETADQPCLGIGSICEFGNSRADLAAVNHAFGEILREAIGSRVEEAQADGDIAGHLKPTMIADFILANIAGLRIAGRGGADAGSLASLADVTLRALR